MTGADNDDHHTAISSLTTLADTSHSKSKSTKSSIPLETTEKNQEGEIRQLKCLLAYTSTIISF